MTIEAQAVQPAKRAYNRRPVRQEEVRQEPVRAAGKTRTRKGGGTDQLHIPSHLIPEDIDLQWNTVSVHGAPELQMMAQMHAQAWEPVLIGMFDGRFDYLMPKGHNGEILIGGLRLEYRPLELSLEAKAEDRQAAGLAVGIQESKLRRGQLDGVTLDTQHPTARAKTYLTREVLSGSPIPKG